MGESIGYGLIGAGSFGQFCLQQYRQMKQVRVVAVADANAQAARRAADALGVASESVDALLKRDDIDFVHIATPPFTHHDLAMEALDAGKHVLCEKPLATSLDDAEAMVRRAQEKERVLAVNLIMRYNPLVEAVKRLIDERLLGEPLHGFFENYAKDENLPPEHWFWRRDKSGGIFVEHGVHFFDLYRWWLGDGQVVCANQSTRPGAGFVEQVQCTFRHASPSGDASGGVLVNHYHGFTQATRMDRQEMRILFERGTLKLYEWVPTEAEIDTLANEATARRILEILPDARLAARRSYTGDERHVVSRHKRYDIDGRYHIRASAGMEKQALYGHVIRGLLADQIARAHNPAHERRITEDNGLRSLADAVRAQELADTAS